MKEWTIHEFLKECAELCWNQYTYDYSRMPEGICNGHHVKPYMGSWHSIVIDGGICNMATYNEQYPNGSTMYGVDGKNMTALEYVVYKLSEERQMTLGEKITMIEQTNPDKIVSLKDEHGVFWIGKAKFVFGAVRRDAWESKRIEVI